MANLSLSKMPWYAQIGAFVLIAVALAGAFYYFVEAPKQVTLQAQTKELSDIRGRISKGQSAPVHMIDQISKALPDMTWITNIQQSGGYTLQIQGRCLTLTSLSDFIGNLESSRYFMRPVEIIETSVAAGSDKEGPELIQFTIRGTFQMAGVDSVAPPPPGTKGAPKGGKRG